MINSDEECDDGSQCDDGTDCTEDASVCGVGTCAPRDGDGCSASCVIVEECPAGTTPERIDLSRWEVVQYELDDPPILADWQLSDGDTVATQTMNADASILMSNFGIRNGEIEGSWRVDNTTDDDYMGFVFGVQSRGRFYLFDWKKGDQGGAVGFAERGMSIKLFDCEPEPIDSDFWATAGRDCVTVLRHNTMSWAPSTDYTFRLDFVPGEFTIEVSQGASILESWTVSDDTYDSGGFGFYNYSQGAVRYAGFEGCIAECGNGVVDAGEACDDGADNGDDKPCTNACELAVCGDDLVCSDPACETGPSGGPEECDPPNGATCDDSCAISSLCGNGVVDPGEDCDGTELGSCVNGCYGPGNPNRCECVVGSCDGTSGGPVFLTCHDPDFHAQENSGARNINRIAIDFVLNPAWNEFAASGVAKFLFVESSISPPNGHLNGVDGIEDSGYSQPDDFEHHTASTLGAELDQLGTKYGALVVASDFGGVLTQSELDILNARVGDIAAFVNAGGGLYALAESNSQAGLTPQGGHFAFVPGAVSSVALGQNEDAFSVTPFGAGLGLTNADVRANVSHCIFDEGPGVVVDVDGFGRTMSLADCVVLETCNGDGIRDGSEECDGTDDEACPGLCLPKSDPAGCTCDFPCGDDDPSLPCAVSVDDPPGTFDDLQDAIDDANNGATITIDGVCRGPIEVEDRADLTIQGVAPEGGCRAYGPRPRELTSTVRKGRHTIKVTDSERITVRYLNIIGARSEGLEFKRSIDSVAMCNCFSENRKEGIELDIGGGHVVTQNLSKDNRRDGINLDESAFNAVYANTSRNNEDDGIELQVNSDDNVVFDNYFLRNEADGIELHMSDRNCVTDNVVMDNGEEPWRDFGIQVRESDENGVDGNIVLGNADENDGLVFCHDGSKDNEGDNVVEECGTQASPTCLGAPGTTTTSMPATTTTITTITTSTTTTTSTTSTTTTTVPGPACGNNGECQSGEFCDKADGDCSGTGLCVATPDLCAPVILPVCGCNGVTYNNACQANAAFQSIGDPDGPCP